MRIRSLTDRARRRIHRRSDFLWPFLALAVALIALRAALPFIVKDYVNRRLHALEAYDGSVADIDVSLWRGAYRIDGIEIVKRGAKAVRTPFFDARRVDFSVEWHSLLRGSLVAEAQFFEPKLNLVEAPNDQQEQLGKEEHWHARLEELFPFKFNTIGIHDGTITFRTPGIDTRDALVSRNVDGEITNITNVAGEEKDNFAEFQLGAQVLGGKAHIDGSAEPFTQRPTFDVNLSLEDVNVPKVNPWLRKYLKADAQKGNFDLYLEVASSNGRYKGYAKPMLHDVQFLSAQEAPKENPLKSLWQGTLQIAAELFENQPRQQVAAEVPFNGTVEGGKTELLAAITSVLRNAFVSAFTHSIENRISLKDVKPGEPSGDADPTSG